MLYLLLEEPLALTGRRATAAARLLQAGVQRLETFRRAIDDLHETGGRHRPPSRALPHCRAHRGCSPLRRAHRRDGAAPLPPMCVTGPTN